PARTAPSLQDTHHIQLHHLDVLHVQLDVHHVDRDHLLHHDVHHVQLHHLDVLHVVVLDVVDDGLYDDLHLLVGPRLDVDVPLVVTCPALDDFHLAATVQSSAADLGALEAAQERSLEGHPQG